MVIVASAEKAAASRRAVNPGGMLPAGTQNWRTSLVGPSRFDLAANQAMPGPDEIYPHAFLIEQPPNAQLRTHFHTPHQFQVVVSGSGTLGPHPIRFGSVHFTGPNTPYGPIKDAGEGVQYMTRRNGWDPGANYMPESREVLRELPRTHREHSFGPAPHLNESELATSKDPLSLVMLPLESDGLGAWFHRVPAGATLCGPDPSESGGQFWFVMGGALDAGTGELLKKLSCVFVSPDEAPFTAKAGPGGLEILALQYPVLVKH